MIPGHATAAGTARVAAANPACYREFAGLSLSTVGMGTYLGDQDDATDRLVEAAVASSLGAGVNVVDTAANYRGQRAERSVGRALAAGGGVPRDGVFVSTKGGYLSADSESGADFWAYVKKEFTDTGIVKEGDVAPTYHCMSPAYLRDQLDRSLANLGLDCIDLLYLHNPAEGQLQARGMEALHSMIHDAFCMYEEERKRGRIAHYGIATWDSLRVPPSDPRHLSLEEVVSIARRAGGRDHGLRFVQLPLNMYSGEALLQRTQVAGGREVTALEAAGSLGLGVFTSAPFMQGRLLAPGTMPEFGDLPPAQRALQFLRSVPGVLAPLAGHKSPAHVEENLRLMGMPPMTPGEADDLVRRLVS
ncbi:MAG: aldo/keto reductase [Nitrosopumilus sp.]|nr:aldo/keto reductase [Nitrosopumilus sp.]